MFENNYISGSPLGSIFLNAAKGALFYSIFIVYGILRLCRAVLLFCLNLFFRIGFSVLFYLSLLMIASLALVIVLSYYLIAVFGSQVRLP